MPEQREAEQATLDRRVEQALDYDLSHHDHQPDQAGCNMQSVTADQGKKGREKSATLRSCPDGDHASELPELQRQEPDPQDKRRESSQISEDVPSRSDGQRHQSTGVARREKATGFDCNAALVEQLHPTRTASGRVREYRVTGEERRKHHDVAQEEYPEAVANHDPLCSGTGLTCTRPRLVTNLIINCNSDVHTAISDWFACSKRAI